jgi:hypothetical protein
LIAISDNTPFFRLREISPLDFVRVKSGMAKKFSELTSGAVSSDDYVPTSRGTGNYKVNLVGAVADILASTPPESPGYRYTSGAVVTNTGNLTLDNTYNGKIILSDNTTSIAYTVASGLSAGFSCSVLQNGTGITTFTGASGVSLNSYGSLRQIAGQYGSAYLQWVSSNSYILAGNLS